MRETYGDCPYELILETFKPVRMDPGKCTEPFRYAANHEAGAYLDFDKISIYAEHEAITNPIEFKLDPLRAFLRRINTTPGHSQLGRWCPGRIETTNNKPADDYMGLTKMVCIDEFRSQQQ